MPEDVFPNARATQILSANDNASHSMKLTAEGSRTGSLTAVDDLREGHTD